LPLFGYQTGVSDSVIAAVLAYAAGVMVTVSIGDLIMPAIQGAQNVSGVVLYAGCVLAGMLAMATASYFMPSDVAATIPFFSASDKAPPAGSSSEQVPSEEEAVEAGLLTAAEDGDAQAAETAEEGAPAAGALSDTAAATGSHGDDADAADTVRSRAHAAAGAASSAAAGAATASPGKGRGAVDELLLQRQSRLAFVMFVALSLHNLPEGVAVAVSSLSSTAQGNDMTIAIAVHNAVEGLALATPVLAATGSLWKALAAALVSGLTEPLGALITLLALGQASAGSSAGPATTQGLEAVLSAVTCLVAGVMTQVSLQELLPEAYAASVRSAASHGAKGHPGRAGGSASGTVGGWQVLLPVVAGAAVGAATMPAIWQGEALLAA
jgi:zinc transporter ZupT